MAQYIITRAVNLYSDCGALSGQPQLITIPLGAIVEGNENTKEGATQLVFTYNKCIFKNLSTGYQLYGASNPTPSPNPTPNTMTTKYYNATVQVAKYGHKVGDAIQVKSSPNPKCPQGMMGCQNNIISTVGKDNETWILYYDTMPNFVAPLKIGSEIPASDIENKGGDVAPTTTSTIFTTKNILIGIAVLLLGYIAYKQFKK